MNYDKNTFIKNFVLTFNDDASITRDAYEIKEANVFSQGTEFAQDGIMGPQFEEHQKCSCRCGKLHGEANEGLYCSECETMAVKIDPNPNLYISLPFGYLGNRTAMACSWLNVKKTDLNALIRNRKVLYNDEHGNPKICKMVELPPTVRQKNLYSTGDTALSKLFDVSWNRIYKTLDFKIKWLTCKHITQVVNNGYSINTGIGFENPAKMNADIEKAAINENFLLKLLDYKTMAHKLEEAGYQPSSLILHYLPVLPAEMRPVNDISSTTKIGDMNVNIINLLKSLDTVRATSSTSCYLTALKNAYSCIDKYINGKISFIEELQQQNQKNIEEGPIISIADAVTAKSNYVRNNVLGHKVAYSARGVAVNDPNMGIDEIGLSMESAMALQELKVLKRLTSEEHMSIKQARQEIDSLSETAQKALKEVCATSMVLFGRQPSKDRGTIHAVFIHPLENLAEDAGFHINPIFCKPLGADFDGDPLFAFCPIPLSENEIFEELRPSKNLISVHNGNLNFEVAKDGVLGLNLLTDNPVSFKMNDTYKIVSIQGDITDNVCQEKCFAFLKKIKYDSNGQPYTEGPNYESDLELEVPIGSTINFKEGNIIKTDEVLAVPPTEYNIEDYGEDTLKRLMEGGALNVELNVQLSEDSEEQTPTTYGRLALYTELSEAGIEIDFEDINKPLTGKNIPDLVKNYLKSHSVEETSKLIFHLQQIGFKYAGYMGASLNFRDVNIDTTAITEELKEKDFSDDILTQQFYQNNIETIKTIMKNLDPSNGYLRMFLSGAAGKDINFTRAFFSTDVQRGFDGKLAPVVTAGVTNVLSPVEKFGTEPSEGQGINKGDVVGKSANIQRVYTEALADIAIIENDCGTKDELIVSFDNRKNFVNRYLSSDLYTQTGEKIFERNTLVVGEVADKIESLGKENKLFVKENNNLKGASGAPVRDAGHCHSHNGICRHCFGADISRPNEIGEEVEIGYPVGVIAGTSAGTDVSQQLMKQAKMKAPAMDTEGEFQNMSPIDKFTRITNGSAIASNLAVSDPDAAYNQIIKEFTEFYKSNKIDVDPRAIEIVARYMIVVVPQDGTYKDKKLSFSEYQKLRKNDIYYNKKTPIVGFVIPSQSLHFNPELRKSTVHLISVGNADTEHVLATPLYEDVNIKIGEKPDLSQPITPSKEDVTIISQMNEDIKKTYEMLKSRGSNNKFHYYAGIGSRNASDSKDSSKIFATEEEKKNFNETQEIMTKISSRLEKLGYVLRTGGAMGCDQAFMKGVQNPKKVINYAPYKYDTEGYVLKDDGKRKKIKYDEIQNKWIEERRNEEGVAIDFKGNPIEFIDSNGNKSINTSFSPKGAVNWQSTAVGIESIEKYHPYPSKLTNMGKKLIERDFYQIMGNKGNLPADFVVCWTKDGKDSGGTGQGIRIANANNIPVFNLRNDAEKEFFLDFLDYLEKGVYKEMKVEEPIVENASTRSEAEKVFEEPQKPENMGSPRWDQNFLPGFDIGY